jgi:undecaprenyl-diphosphatase
MIAVRLIRGAAGVAMVLASLEEARKADVPLCEQRAFRIANDAPDAIRIPVRAVMQAGTFITVPIVALVAAATGRRSLAVDLAGAGTLAWFGAKALKPLAGRGRPESLLPDVHVRERIAGDLGWVSGHAAVATTLAATAWPVLPRSARPAVVAVVATTAFGRMYVGAHLPLDLVGGAGLGLILSTVMQPADEHRRDHETSGERRVCLRQSQRR